jgi:hypothetical protein
MDEHDKEDFREICEEANDIQLVNMCEYELKQAKEASFDEESELHYECADIAYTEMERRHIV